MFICDECGAVDPKKCRCTSAEKVVHNTFEEIKTEIRLPNLAAMVTLYTSFCRFIDQEDKEEEFKKFVISEYPGFEMKLVENLITNANLLSHQVSEKLS